MAYEAFASKGLDGFLEHFTDDVEFDVLAGGHAYETREQALEAAGLSE